MSLKSIINEDMKQLMRDKDTYALEAIRMLKSDIKNAEIELMRELEDDEVIRVVQSSIKKSRDALEASMNAGREDLADKERRYMKVFSKYLPEQLSEAEIEKIVKEVLTRLGDIDLKTGFGTVIKAVMAEVGNRADGKTVSTKVKEVIQGKNQ